MLGTTSSSRAPLAVVQIVPSQRSKIARSIAPGGARRERDDGFLAAFAGDRQGAVPAFGPEGFGPEGFDVSACGFRCPQSVEGEQRDQGAPGRGAEPGCNEQCADFVRSRPVAWGS
jgi:hypothetical protein